MQSYKNLNAVFYAVIAVSYGKEYKLFSSYSMEKREKKHNRPCIKQ